MSNSYFEKLKHTKHDEHAFAPIIRILGKGKTGSRSLSYQEAYTAMQMILRSQVSDIQLGAFLMLLRVKEESADELAGFVQATREHIAAPTNIKADLDWSSYAGKKRQLPWFLLCCFLLADEGVRILMHGASGHTAGRLYTETVLKHLNIPIAKNWNDVDQQLQETNFSFMPLEQLCPVLHAIIGLRNQLGLRSPVHTLSRLINPLAASYSIQSVFHPAYSISHQQASLLLKQPNSAVFKGEGGEIERKPEANCMVKEVHNGVASEELWGKLVDGRQATTDLLKTQELVELWRGNLKNSYGEMTVIATTAIVLKLLGREKTQQQAMKSAEQLWAGRNRSRFT